MIWSILYGPYHMIWSISCRLFWNFWRLQDYDECLKISGFWSERSETYISCSPKVAGEQGFQFAFWLLLHFITVNATDDDATTCAAIISNFILTFHEDQGNCLFSKCVRILIEFRINGSKWIVGQLWEWIKVWSSNCLLQRVCYTCSKLFTFKHCVKDYRTKRQRLRFHRRVCKPVEKESGSHGLK